MTPDRWRRIEEIFAAAVERPADQRGAFVAAECGLDTSLREEIDELLAATEGAEHALRRVVGDGATTLAMGRFGSYRVIRLLGEGGMGTVYLAERADAAYRRPVAVKVLRGGLASPEALARFRDERQVLATLDHPGIVRLLDGGQAGDGTPYLVMDYIAGTPFATYARDLSVRQLVALTIRVAEALQYAHQQLIVHRDVKPSNLLIDRTGAPRLLDFGIAKLLDPAALREAETRTGAGAFTIEYASPEQVRGESVTVATDVYSLAAVLYDALVGSPVQRAGASPLETLANICDREPPRPSVAAAGPRRRALAGDLDNILLRALAKRADRRYPSMAAFAADLQRYLDGLPVVARAATLLYRTGKLVRRHRAAIAVTAIIAAALSTATVVSVRAARRADREAARAESGRRTLLIERGRQELDNGYPGRALPYLAEALRAGADTPPVRVLLGAAMRPYQAQIATMTDRDGFADAAWSPDGRLVALTSASARGGLYDRDGRRLANLDDEGAQDLAPVFSPDGGLVASADITGRLFIWETLGGTRVQTLRVAESRWPVGAVFVDADRIITAASDGRVALWDARSGAPLLTVDAGRPLRSVAVSTDRSIIAVGGDAGEIRLFDSRTLAPSATLVGHRGLVARLAFAPDDSRLYSGSVDGTTKVWSLTRGTVVVTLTGGQMSLSNDGTRLLTSGEDSVIRVHVAADGTLLALLVGHARGGVRATNWSPDDTTITTAGIDGTFRIWDSATGEQRGAFDADVGAGRARNPSIGAVQALVSPDGERLLTLSGNAAALWMIDGGPLRAAIPTGGQLWSAAWSPDEQWIAFAGDGRGGLLGPAAPATTFAFDGASWMYDVNWSPDGTRVVISGRPDVARIVDRSGRVSLTLQGHAATVNRAAFSPDGRHLATASSDHSARIWDATTGAEVRALAHPGAVMAASWSRDGTHVVTAGMDHHLRVWSVATGELEVDLDGGMVGYLDATLSPDGRQVAAAGRAGEVEVWDLRTRRRRLALVGHTLNATNAVWSHDGALIATASSDHTARVWDAINGALLATFRHPDEVMSLQWSQDDARLLSGCHDGVARVWDVRRATGTPKELDEFVRAHVASPHLP